VGGHYLYVDRNLIELIAVLAIAGAGTGRWLGLDGLLEPWWRRRRVPAMLPPAELAATRGDKPADEPEGVSR
jgi:hypothetical protein